MSTKAHFEGNSIIFQMQLIPWSLHSPFEKYGQRHYRSFSKSTKRHFFQMDTQGEPKIILT